MREKRKFIRFNVALKVAYIVQKDPKLEKTGVTKDVSAQGMQLLAGEKLAPGEKLDLKIFIPDALNPAHIKGIVLWSKALEPGKSYTFSAGVDFKKIEEDNKNTFLKFLCDLVYQKTEKRLT
ncbi:MAG: PilZ domain-containing protein [Candidatus Omnitrophota bacterium]|nr:PilZ domain-containing protein [Candidatus Omnitrophota bacterium]